MEKASPLAQVLHISDSQYGAVASMIYCSICCNDSTCCVNWV
jgi:hypothetical protein